MTGCLYCCAKMLSLNRIKVRLLGAANSSFAPAAAADLMPAVCANEGKEKQ